MPRTRINCPNCRQQITAEVDQLFDVGLDPTLKQKFLSGAFNVAHCPHCGYQGMLAMPLVYHDPNKELLLTYFPAELGLPVNEQERTIGPLITKVTNDLPQEKRKAYLLRPQTMLTLQGMLERVLEADGITKEMIQAQQKRLALLQQLASASSESLKEIASREDATMDNDFFNLLSRLIETSRATNDQASASRLNDVQNELLPLTTVGKQILERNKEIEAAMQSLQALGKEATRESLLDLVIKAPSDLQVSVIANLARPGMDYEFFRMLSERIDQASGDTRARLTTIREQLLEITGAIDKQIDAIQREARQLLNNILQAMDVKEAMIQNLGGVNDYFVQVFNEEMERARKAGDLERIGKLKLVEEVVDEASAPPPEVALIEELLEAAGDESKLDGMIAEHSKDITPEFLDILTSLVMRDQQGQNPELVKRLNAVYQAAIRLSMKANLS